MVPVGAIFGAVKAIGQIAGSAMTIAENKKREKQRKEYYDNEKAKLDARESSDGLATQNASNVRNAINEQVQRGVQKALNLSRVTGQNVNAAVAPVMQEGIDKTAEANGQIAADAEERKENIRDKQAQLNKDRHDELEEIHQERMQSLNNIVQNSTDVVSSGLGSIGGGAEKPNFNRTVDSDTQQTQIGLGRDKLTGKEQTATVTGNKMKLNVGKVNAAAKLRGLKIK